MNDKNRKLSSFLIFLKKFSKKLLTIALNECIIIIKEGNKKAVKLIGNKILALHTAWKGR